VTVVSGQCAQLATSMTLCITEQFGGNIPLRLAFGKYLYPTAVQKIASATKIFRGFLSPYRKMRDKGRNSSPDRVKNYFSV
jgi:hypothetical protein